MVSTELRDAFRSLRATPVITAVAALSLALGIGANAALFSILNGLTIKALPVRDPQGLALVGEGAWSHPIWEEIRDRHAHLFAGAFAWSNETFDLAASGRSDIVDGVYASGTFFETLGVTPAMGRLLTSADDRRGGGADGLVAVISHRLWQRRFASAPAGAIGQRLIVNRVPFIIVGVAPPGFFGPEVGRAADVFLPLAAEAAIRGRESNLDERAASWLEIMVRVKPGQTLDAAAAALNRERPAIHEATVPLTWTGEDRANFLRAEFTVLAAATGRSTLRQRFATPLAIILAVVGAVLLIACANIANVMLARATARRHEMSVRLALGASRGRLARQLFAESLLLAAAGGLAALIVGQAGSALLVRQLGSAVSAVSLDVSIDWRVLGFTAAVALIATLLFGLAPALGLGRIAPDDALKTQGRGVVGDRRIGWRHALVVTQVALSLVLVTGAALFVRTFASLVLSPIGFDPTNLVIVSADARRTDVAPEQRASFFQRVADAAGAVSGVRRASLSFLTPMSGRGWTERIEVVGGPTLERPQQITSMNRVTPGWFETYGMRLLAGRDFNASDTRGTEPAAIVNETFVRCFFGQTSPIGRRVKSVGINAGGERVIIGVVNDAIYRTTRLGVVPTMYVAMTQAKTMDAGFAVTVEMPADRAGADPAGAVARRGADRPADRSGVPVVVDPAARGREAIARDISDAIARIDPKLSFSFRDVSDQVGATLIQERLVALLSGFFGLLALLLAALGLYGVTSYAVSRRRAEIAVRMALGAGTRDVLSLILRRVTVLIGAGIAAGLALSLWAAKFIGALLFQVEPRDPLTFVSAAAVLAVIGLFAGWLPARRAARLSATAALRS